MLQKKMTFILSIMLHIKKLLFGRLSDLRISLNAPSKQIFHLFSVMDFQMNDQQLYPAS